MFAVEVEFTPVDINRSTIEMYAGKIWYQESWLRLTQ